MEFALMYEVPNPSPWYEGQEHEALMDFIEEAKLADRVGFHSLWTVEHHFQKELSMMSAPEVVYGYLAAVTENMKIGHSVRLMPHPYNPPVRIAEQAAMVDHLLEGRFLFGIGRSATRGELEGFGIDPMQTKDMQLEALDTVITAWTEDEYSYDGKFWKQPTRRLVPKPYQKPHPPVWMATTSDDGHVQVGELGLNLLSFTVGVPVEVIADRVKGYREGLSRAKPATKLMGNQVGIWTLGHCAPTNEEAAEEAGSSFEWYLESNGKFITDLAEWLAEKSEHSGTYQYIRDRADAIKSSAKPEDVVVGAGLTYDGLIDMAAVVSGDPERCIELAKRYADAGADMLLLLPQPHHIPHEKVMQSIELFGTKVAPELKNYEPKRD